VIVRGVFSQVKWVMKRFTALFQPVSIDQAQGVIRWGCTDRLKEAGLIHL
jgi:hypothetical protein